MTPSVNTRYVSRNVLRKSILRNLRSVNRCNRRSGVAERICGILQEFKVRLNLMSTSSLNSFGSFRMDCGIVTELVSDNDPWSRSLKRTLSMHWLISLTHAAFSYKKFDHAIILYYNTCMIIERSENAFNKSCNSIIFNFFFFFAV